MLTVALLQMTANGNDQSANLVKGELFCRHARAMGADIALFPELWNIGYSSYRSQEPAARTQWQAQAVGSDDPFVSHFQALARSLEMAIAITYLERQSGDPQNTVSLVDRHGEIVLTYAKVHTCDFDSPEDACAPGDEFQVCTLDTAQGEVQIGAMICFDREFPESARILMLKGAEIILTPNACEMEANRIGQFKARAFENMVGLALANYAAPQANGHSLAVDAIAFDQEGRAVDPVIVQAGDREGIYLAPFDLYAIRAYRMREVWGNAFRRPNRYHLLTSPQVQEPFLRNRTRGEPFDRANDQAQSPATDPLKD